MLLLMRGSWLRSMGGNFEKLPDTRKGVRRGEQL